MEFTFKRRKADDSCSWLVYQNLITMFRRLFFYKSAGGRYIYHCRFYKGYLENGFFFAEPSLYKQKWKIIYIQFLFLYLVSIFFKTKIKRAEAISL